MLNQFLHIIVNPKKEKHTQCGNDKGEILVRFAPRRHGARGRPDHSREMIVMIVIVGVVIAIPGGGRSGCSVGVHR